MEIDVEEAQRNKWAATTKTKTIAKATNQKIVLKNLHSHTETHCCCHSASC